MNKHVVLALWLLSAAASAAETTPPAIAPTENPLAPVSVPTAPASQAPAASTPVPTQTQPVKPPAQKSAPVAPVAAAAQQTKRRDDIGVVGPSWLREEQGNEVDHFHRKRELERERELATLRAEIAEKEAAVRKFNKPEKSEESQVVPGSESVHYMPGFDPNIPITGARPKTSLGQMAAPTQAEPAPPPPAPAPPQLLYIVGNTATIKYNGERYEATRGDKIADSYTVADISYDHVLLRAKDKTELRLMPPW